MVYLIHVEHWDVGGVALMWYAIAALLFSLTPVFDEQEFKSLR